MWQHLLHQKLTRMIRHGALNVTYPDGTTALYGSGEPRIHATLHDPAVLRRLVQNPELALGEAYMEGSLTVGEDDLFGFMSLLLLNARRSDAAASYRPNPLAAAALRRATQFNPAGRARANVAHHYDLSSDLYRLFLDRDMQYSCAYFRAPSDTLEQAQAQKKAHIAAKLRLTPGMRVLDIGCGWGGLALSLARDHGARVLGVTLSVEQHRIATERARAERLEDRVEFRLTDYREVQGQFDRVVSVGMFEHVGVPHYEAYFGTVHDLLTEDGIALIHTIGRAAPPGATGPWIRKYIFPGGYVPALSEMMRAVERRALFATDVEVWRLHYALTLAAWRQRFEANLDRVRALYDERFCRMWRYYLIASELSFRLGRQVVFQVQLARRLDAVPLTRDYLYRPQAPDKAMAAE